MCTAQKCPVCYGKGKVPVESPYYSGCYTGEWLACHGCGGSGWVTVHCINELTLPTVTVTIDGIPIEKAFPEVSVMDGLGYFQWPPQCVVHD
jgi:hypothetical protein